VLNLDYQIIQTDFNEDLKNKEILNKNGEVVGKVIRKY
jgi:hypothetical protein